PAARHDREALRIARFNDLRFPENRVGEPAFGVEPHAPPQTARVGWPHLLDVEINRRPPPHEGQGVAEDVGHLAARSVDAPARDELVLVAHLTTAAPTSFFLRRRGT